MISSVFGADTCFGLEGEGAAVTAEVVFEDAKSGRADGGVVVVVVVLV